LPADVAREGFPGWSCEQFIEMYCRANNCTRYAVVTRIEFRRIDGQGQAANSHQGTEPPSEEAVRQPSDQACTSGGDLGLRTLDSASGEAAVVLLPSIRMPRLVTRGEVDRSYRRNEKRCVAHGINCIA